MAKLPINKLLSDEGDNYAEFEGAEDYDPSSGDPLRKQKKMDFIGGEMDQLASTGYKGGSTAGGPLSNPTQYGDVGGKFDIPFAGQQAQQLSPQRGLEGAIEDALEQEIKNFEAAKKANDVIGEMTAGSNINKLQNELSRELQVSQKAQETMGETYEDRAMRQRVTKAYQGRVDPMNVELAIEDARPLPTTKKGKGPGQKSAESIIKTGLEARRLPTEKLKDGEYSTSPSSMRQASVERALREGAGPGSPKPRPYMSDPGTDKRKLPYDFRESMFGNTKGILGETTADAGKTYGRGPTFTGVDAQGNIIQPKPAVQFKSQSPFPDDPSKVQEPKRLQPEYGEALDDYDGPAYDAQTMDRDVPMYDIEDAQEASRNFDSLDNYPNRAEDFDPKKIGNTNPDGLYTGSKPPKYNAQQQARINQQARIAERRGQKPTGKFQGKKVSGNKVSSVTPDAPKAVTSDAGFDLRKAVSDNVAKGMDANRALKIAKLEERLAKVKGRGKGKGKLLTTLGAVGIGAILNKDR